MKNNLARHTPEVNIQNKQKLSHYSNRPAHWTPNKPHYMYENQQKKWRKEPLNYSYSSVYTRGNNMHVQKYSYRHCLYTYKNKYIHMLWHIRPCLLNPQKNQRDLAINDAIKVVKRMCEDVNIEYYGLPSILIHSYCLRFVWSIRNQLLHVLLKVLISLICLKAGYNGYDSLFRIVSFYVNLFRLLIQSQVRKHIDMVNSYVLKSLYVFFYITKLSRALILNQMGFCLTWICCLYWIGHKDHLNWP